MAISKRAKRLLTRALRSWGKGYTPVESIEGAAAFEAALPDLVAFGDYIGYGMIDHINQCKVDGFDWSDWEKERLKLGLTP